MGLDGAPLLEVRNLTVGFTTRQGRAAAVDSLSFRLAPGEVLGVVGESGAGKSAAAMSIPGLLRGPGVQTSGGRS